MQGIALSVVVPVYNEEAVIELMYRTTRGVLDGMRISYEMIFVNDGSQDCSAQFLGAIASRDDSVRVIEFTRNFGHEAAMAAGLEASRGQAVVLIDGDLQDPPELIPALYAQLAEGFDVVYAQRVVRHGESLFKRISARWFYRLLRRSAVVKIPVDTGNFRVISRRVVDTINGMPEKARFARGMIAWTGFAAIAVPYERSARAAGFTKYSLGRMVDLALISLLGFARSPLRATIWIGAALMSLALMGMIVLIAAETMTGHWALTGLPWMMSLLGLVAGVQFILIGFLGELVSRVYEESQSRPQYVINHLYNFDTPTESADEITAARQGR